MFFILILCNISLVSNAQSKFSPKPAVGQEITYDFTNVWSCISTTDSQKVTNRFAKCSPSFEEGLNVEKYYGTKQDSVHTSFAVKVVNVSPYSITFSFRLLKAYDDKKNVVKREKEDVKDKKEKIFEDSIPALFCSHPVLVTYTPAMDRCIVSNQSELVSLLIQLSQRINQEEVKPLQYPLIYAYPGELYLLNTNIDGKGSEILYMLQIFCPAIELVVDAMRKSYTVGISVKGKPLAKREREKTPVSHTLIIFFDKKTGSKPLLKAIKKQGCTLLYKYKEFSGVAVKVDEKHDIDQAIADFKKVKGVTSVNKDGIMQVQ